MNNPQSKLTLYINAVFIVSAMAIIVDFIISGYAYTKETVSVQKEEQLYYNAGGNSHYSYQVVTSEHKFSVTEEFAETIQNSEKITYSVSYIFKEVNWYGLPSSDDRYTYSFRTMSGLVLPLLTILSILVAFRFKKKIGTLVFVLQTLLLADLIFLLI